MTKYVILGDKLYKNVKEREDFAPEMVFMNRVNGAQIDKIFSNPITAIAYDVDSDDFIKCDDMDKNDIIRAVDFWINDKVLENEKILKLEDKLDDVHEIELKQLIDIRTKIEKLPNDSKFTRFVDYDTIECDTNQFRTEIVNFYQLLEKIPTKPNKSHCYASGTVSFVELSTNSGSINNRDNFFWRPITATVNWFTVTTDATS